MKIYKFDFIKSIKKFSKFPTGLQQAFVPISIQQFDVLNPFNSKGIIFFEFSHINQHLTTDD